ncbi:hypothetical protein F0231_01255 [Vibrio sp. RE86]|nr:hypothetical protein [Vibrio sp. RE86]
MNIILGLLLTLGYPTISSAANLPLGPLATQDIEEEQRQRLKQLEESTNALQELTPTPCFLTLSQ